MRGGGVENPWIHWNPEGSEKLVSRLLGCSLARCKLIGLGWRGKTVCMGEASHKQRAGGKGYR